MVDVHCRSYRLKGQECPVLSLSSCTHMCSPSGHALNALLSSTNHKGIPGRLTVHGFGLTTLCALLSMWMTLTQQVMLCRDDNGYRVTDGNVSQHKTGK